MVAPRPSDKDGGGKTVSLPRAFVALLASVVVALAAGRESRKYFFPDENTSTPLPLHRHVLDSQTCSSITWIKVDSEKEGVTEESEQDDVEQEDDRNYSAHQMFVDLKDVDTTRIGSEENLSEFLITFAHAFDLSVTNYYCHTDSNLRYVSCLGALEDGHVGIRSWPSSGKVSFDIFAKGNAIDAEEIEAVKALLADLFYDANGSLMASHLKWGLKIRGSWDVVHSDLEIELESAEDDRTPVASVKSKWQQIDVYDFVTPRMKSTIEQAMAEESDYIASNPERFVPDRALFLDGMVQSTRYGNAAYHESLVHPAMFSHKGPKRVAIIGGGEGATLREVLKHKTVEKVVMIEIDQIMMDTARTALPDWNDCNYFEGSNGNCMDDPRAQIYAEDAFKWFSDRYASPDSGEEPFDIIIMDALDPQNVVEFAGALYGDNTFLGSLYKALGTDGILVAQVGDAPNLLDPPDQYGMSKNRFVFIETLVKLGFESIFNYIEPHCEFGFPWSFFVSFKSAKTSSERWFSSETHFNVEMHKRSIRRKDRQSPFEYFDGATMVSYQRPTKESVSVFCRQTPTPEGCHDLHGFDPEAVNIPKSSLKVAKSLVGKNAGLGVFTMVDVPENSYIALETVINRIMIHPKQEELIYILNAKNKVFEFTGAGNLYELLCGYSTTSNTIGKATGTEVEVSLSKFMMHGCNDTHNVGYWSPTSTELIADLTDEAVIMEHITHQFVEGGEWHVYNPAVLRDLPKRLILPNVRPLVAGEELTTNYLSLSRDKASFVLNLSKVKEQCGAGVGVGVITE